MIDRYNDKHRCGLVGWLTSQLASDTLCCAV